VVDIHIVVAHEVQHLHDMTPILDIAESSSREIPIYAGKSRIVNLV
jgi:hypothetical protein